ncbi:MAG: single-stranded-DNA-specific exonuclease RecJ [Oscillospiraceae bacterium]
MLYRQWNLRPKAPQAAAALMCETGAGALLCDILAARGVSLPEAAALLGASQPLPDPLSLKDMDKAVQRIHAAVAAEEAIVVFGDYDVDGITATALLYTYLESLGAEVYYKLPSRSDDDYGLAPALIDQVADRGIKLVVTVDNGTTAFEAIERAAARGVDVVVTDHHLPYDTLPDVVALVNPCRPDDDSDAANLSGAGVAFMLLAALEGCEAEELLPVFGDLAAIGTVADVMPLTGANRTLVRAGLAALQDTQRPGLAALLRLCGLADKPVTAENISYTLAPRLNAAGRMDNAAAALELLLAEDEDEAAQLVQHLQDQNTARQMAEQEILAAAVQQLESDPAQQRARVLLAHGDGWHQGVIGIVASRLADRYAKPAIVVSFEGDEGKGSGRSVGQFSLHGAIASCEDILMRYGGHDLAAGFSIRRQHLPAFAQRINRWAVENQPVPQLPALWADVAVPIARLTVDEVRQLDAMAPWGSGNPVPRFLIQNAVIDAVYAVSEGKHSRLRLRQGAHSLYVILFGTGPDALAYQPGDAVDALVGVALYDGRNGPQVSATLTEIRPAGMGNEHVLQSALYESFNAGWQPEEETRAMLAPTREDTATVYRCVRDGVPVCERDLRPVLARLGEGLTGRVLTSLAALEELGLIALDEDSARYRVVRVSEKKDLAASRLLQRLGVAP